MADLSNAPVAGFSQRVTLALTGASGVQYGLRLLECLLAADVQVFCLISPAAEVVVATETDWPLPAGSEAQEVWLQQRFDARPGQLRVLAQDDWFAPPASGSSAISAMVVCPCSGGSLSAIATGASNNLIERAADVALKERRSLILVPRETPLSEIHLEQMLKLTRMGAVILPAMPGFYQQPQSVADLIDFVVARILGQLQIEQQLLPPWGESGDF